MASRIEQIIEEIEEHVDSCKFQPLSTTKIVVNKEELEELLRELRLKTPDEIKRYQKIISNKDAILADAQANDTINKSNQQAQSILDSATQDANNIRLSAITYTDDMLANMENILTATIDEAGSRYHALIDSLQAANNTVKQNRSELAPAGSAAPVHDEELPEEEFDVDDSEYEDEEL